jgi:hypothetical protein
MYVSLAAVETHFFQILRRPKPERKVKPNLRERDAKVADNFLLLPPPPYSSSFVFDNRWVVLYNPYLTMRYQCHINVEVCSSITVVKYLYKYVYKGHDRALAVVQPKAGALPAVAPQAAISGADGNNDAPPTLQRTQMWAQVAAEEEGVGARSLAHNT